MKTLRDFLIAEAKLNEEADKLPTMQIGDWKGLQRISPGPITKEVKDILKIQSAKDAKIQAGNELSKAIKDPTGFRKDINISQNDDFAKTSSGQT